MTSPSFSIVIPHLNDLAGLTRTLGSLERLAAGSPTFEVIVADNRSACGLAAIFAVVARFSALQIRVVEVASPGAGPARNGGVAASRAERIAFLDCDCLVDPNWLEVAARALDRADVVGGPVIASTLGDVPPTTPAELFDLLFGFDVSRSFRSDGLLLTANMATTRLWLDRVGPMRAGLSEDRDWCVRARAMSARLAFIEDLTARHVALADTQLLRRRWQRVTRETYMFHLVHGPGRSSRLLYHLTVALSPLVAMVRLMSSRATGASVELRLRTLILLVRIRVERAWLGAQLHLRRPRGADLPSDW